MKLLLRLGLVAIITVAVFGGWFAGHVGAGPFGAKSRAALGCATLAFRGRPRDASAFA